MPVQSPTFLTTSMSRRSCIVVRRLVGPKQFRYSCIAQTEIHDAQAIGKIFTHWVDRSIFYKLVTRIDNARC